MQEFDVVQWKHTHILKMERKVSGLNADLDTGDYSIQLMNIILFFLSSEYKSYFIPSHYYCLYPAWTVENVLWFALYKREVMRVLELEIWNM